MIGLFFYSQLKVKIRWNSGKPTIKKVFFPKEKFIHLKIDITFYAASVNIRTLSNNHKKSLSSFINKSASKSIFF